MKQAIWFSLVFAALILATPAYATGHGKASASSGFDRAKFNTWISEAVKERIMEELSGRGKTVDSISVKVPSMYTPPKDYDSFNVTLPRLAPRGYKIFSLVTFTKNGRVISKVNIIAKVSVVTDVVTASRNIGRGTIITEKDIKVIRGTSQPFNENIISDPADAIGSKLERSVKQGAGLKANILSRPKMINAGDTVSVIAETKAIRITTIGEAKQDGNRGDWIKVTNIDSKKTINARVIGPGEVMVDF